MRSEALVRGEAWLATHEGLLKFEGDRWRRQGGAGAGPIRGSLAQSPLKSGSPRRLRQHCRFAGRAGYASAKMGIFGILGLIAGFGVAGYPLGTP